MGRRGQHGTQMFAATLPPLYRLVQHDGHILGLEPVGDPQGDHGSRVLLLYVEVVEHHGLRQREAARVVMARWEAQQCVLQMRRNQWRFSSFVFVSRNRVAVA